MNLSSNNSHHAALARSVVTSLQKSKFPSLRQFAYLSKVLTRKEIVLLRLCGLAIILNLAFLNLHFYNQATVMAPAVGGVYREGMVGWPRMINPVLAAERPDLDLIPLIFSSLFKYDPISQKIMPDLVENYQISPDALTYTLKLKQNITWHDKTPLTADDIVFTIDRIKDPEYKSPLAALLKDLETQKIDTQTISLKLKEPYALLPSTLTFGIIPAHLFKNVSSLSFPLAEYNVRPIGTGPFIFSKLRKDPMGTIQSLELIRNPDYFAGPPYLKTILIKFFPTREEMIQSLNQKNIDGAGFLGDSGAWVEETTQKQFQVLNPLQVQYTAIFFNTQSQGRLKEQKIRKALTLSIPKEQLAQELYPGGVVVIENPFLPLASAVKTPFNQSREEARGIIQDILGQETAALEKQNKKLKKGIQPPPPPEIKITLTASNTPGQTQLAEKIITAWKEIGIMAELRPVESGKIKKDIIKPRDYEALLFSVKAGSLPDPFQFWHSSQRDWPGLNLSMFSHKEADKILAEGRLTAQETERNNKYQEFNIILNQEFPTIFLWAPRFIYLLPKEISNVNLSQLSSSSDRFAQIEKWSIKQKRTWQ